MNTKRFVLSVLVVYVLLELTGYLIHGVILSSTYMSEEVKVAFRPEADMNSNMWVMYVVDIVWSFFFVFFFVKGYENKGIMEGVRFGVYVALFWSLVNAYGSYVVYPIPYSLAMQWFIYGLIQSVILGIAVSLVYKPNAASQAEPAAA